MVEAYKKKFDGKKTQWPMATAFSAFLPCPRARLSTHVFSMAQTAQR